MFVEPKEKQTSFWIRPKHAECRLIGRLSETHVTHVRLLIEEALHYTTYYTIFSGYIWIAYIHKLVYLDLNVHLSANQRNRKTPDYGRKSL